MQPVFQERVWGGRRLEALLGKPLPEGRPIGESWELADHPHGRSRVAGGPHAGRTLQDLLREDAAAVLGDAGAASGPAGPFPLMVKFIDAADRLSVQVHPWRDEAAGGEGRAPPKTECWVVLHADPDAWVVEGLVPGTSRASLAAAVREGGLTDLLHVRPVSAGDFVWVPAGLLHAIGPGVVLAEVQQTSDATYRVHDWDRVGLDGRPRPLHVREALEAVRLADDLPPPAGRGVVRREGGLRVESLAACPAFTLARVRVEGRAWRASTGGAWAVVVVLEGAGRVASDEGELPLDAGETVLVPAGATWYSLDAREGLTALVAAPRGAGPAVESQGETRQHMKEDAT
jgi:mannose-6-phosphate isomerase